jgi:acyl-CoA synthetase (AMP-forming)/AMP-acid ligase II
LIVPVAHGADGWGFADIWEAVADQLPGERCVVQGQLSRTWAEVDRRADGIARTLLDGGAVRQDKVAQYLYNCPAYVETLFGCFKSGLVPVNTNYRYTADELVYLWDNADAVAVVFHGTFTSACAAVRDRVLSVRTWLWVDDGSDACPAWAVPYEEAATSSTSRVVAPWGRSGDDLYLLYTGGTTGMPKGVMWRQDDLAITLGQGLGLALPEEVDLAVLNGRFAQPGPVGLPACPLMHGTGAFSALGALSAGGSLALLESRTFDAVELWDTVEREQVNTIAIVGDAFAKPLLQALEDHPGRWDLSSLLVIVSSGVMWSEPTKQGLLTHHPGMLLIDAFSSSEALGMGQSVSAGDQAATTATFQLGPNTIVVDDNDRPVEPGSDEVGRLAVGGRQPIGYYKDAEKSARTFLLVDGRRYSCPGDYATVAADGAITVLGRGSVCINTGGEKVFPEEVEEVLKTHPAVTDAAVVGLPHERFGEMVIAVVESKPATAADGMELIEHVRSRLAAYKAPRAVVVVESVGRAPNGKLDYARLRELAADRVATVLD